MKMKTTLAALALLLAATPVDAAGLPAIAITNGTLIDGAGHQHPNTTVLLSGGKVQAVGQLTVQPGVKTIDARGAWVSAGLFDAASHVGLEELGEDDVSHDDLGSDANHPVEAGLRIADGFYPAAPAIPVTRIAGVTTAALVPGGGLLAGQGAVVELAGPDPKNDARVVKRTFGQFGSLGVEDAHLPGDAARARLMGALRELMLVGHETKAVSFTDKLPFGMGLQDLQAVRALAAGKTPLFLAVHRSSDILAALSFAHDAHLPLVLMGAEEGWMVAKQIAAAHVPVILNPLADLPESLESRGSRLDNAALLHRAGVRVAIGTWSAENGRNLRQEAGVAVANGLPWEAAWQAVTTEPARIYGLGGQYGDVAPGRAANLVVWGGDPFEPGTEVKAVIIGGRSVSLESRQTLLARRYRTLPPR